MTRRGRQNVEKRLALEALVWDLARRLNGPQLDLWHGTATTSVQNTIRLQSAEAMRLYREFFDETNIALAAARAARDGERVRLLSR